jgi:arsenate reductase
MTPEPRTEKKRVLIFWTGNSAASQMAEGLLRHDAGEYFEVESAGTRPDAVRPEAIAVLHEVEIYIRGQRSKHIDEVGGLQFDFIITVDDNARESCPIFFGHGQVRAGRGRSRGNRCPGRIASVYPNHRPIAASRG